MSRAKTAPLESALPLVFGMAYREFVDSDGVGWRVWSTVPSAGSHLRGGFEKGWLTFEGTGDHSALLRRLVPIPLDWETARDDTLEEMCRAASEISRFTRRRDESGREDIEAGG